MKKYLALLSTLLISFITFSSCTKDDSNDVKESIITLKAEGKKLTFKEFNIKHEYGIISLNAVNHDAKRFVGLLCPDDITKGTYDLSDDDNGIILSYGTDSTVVTIDSTFLVISTSGELKITENNTSGKRLKGTFYFTGEGFSDEPMSITDGEFDIYYGE